MLLLPVYVFFQINSSSTARRIRYGSASKLKSTRIRRGFSRLYIFMVPTFDGTSSGGGRGSEGVWTSFGAHLWWNPAEVREGAWVDFTITGAHLWWNLLRRRIGFGWNCLDLFWPQAHYESPQRREGKGAGVCFTIFWCSPVMEPSHY